MRSTRPSFFALAITLGLGTGLLATGCEPAKAKFNAVSGSVTWKGQPIKGGTINFRSDDGKHVGTGTILDGKYTIPAISGLPAGKYAVAITYPDPKIPAPDPSVPPGPSAFAREMLPAKYASGKELKADIQDLSNDVNFDLK